MKFTNQITKLFCGAAILLACTTSIQAQLNHEMIFRVHSPAIVAGDYAFGPPANGAGQWGPTNINTITGDLAWIDNGTDSLGCTLATNNLTGKIAMVRRGTCTFSLKAYHAQQAGAAACVICDRVAGAALVNMSAGDSASAVTIPIIFLTYADCALLAQQVDAGVPTNASFYVPAAYDAIASYAHNTPFNHVQPLNGLQVTVYNNSVSAASNVAVTATVVDPLGASTTLTETLGSLDPLADSAVVFATGYTPSAIGTYNVVYKTSLNPLDSTVLSFNVNADSTFALDNNNFTPSGLLGGIGPSDADFATGSTLNGPYSYEMGAVYLTGSGPNAACDATTAAFALSNANKYIGKDFIVYLYEEPAGGFLGTEQDYSSFIQIAGGLYTVTAADTMTPHSLMHVDLLDISTGANLVTLQPNKQYMLTVSHFGDGSILAAPRFSYTHIQQYLSLAATTFVDRLYMAGWNPRYAPVIRLYTQSLITGIATKELSRSEIVVFPNPTDRQFSVKLNLEEVSEKVTVKLLSMSGQLLQEHNYNNVQNANYMYNVENLAAGMYLLHVKTDKNQTMQKVVIK